MKIALLGYGKMGKMVEELAKSRGHEIILKIDSDLRPTTTTEDLKVADVVIEFTEPTSAIDNLHLCIDAGVPVVTGTTGWYEKLVEVAKVVGQKNGTLFYASNFSVGVNILFHLNKKLAEIMNGYTDYVPYIEEVHHTEKKDAPSGTAGSLANGLASSHNYFKDWETRHMSDEEFSLNEGTFPVFYAREPEVPGTHKVVWQSGVDAIALEHVAFGREGFALGAVLAAEFVHGKKGVFTTDDLFGFK